MPLNMIGKTHKNRSTTCGVSQFGQGGALLSRATEEQVLQLGKAGIREPSLREQLSNSLGGAVDLRDRCAERFGIAALAHFVETGGKDGLPRGP